MIFGISIHALLAESDGVNRNIANGECKFLSTLSLRRATLWNAPEMPTQEISIHALLAESDEAAHSITFHNNPFLSTLSLRRATSRRGGRKELQRFLSTLSLRRATKLFPKRFSNTLISIHALLAESDQNIEPFRDCPYGISIHALLAESDQRT